MQELRTGRALQLEGLENARNKVTLGFKCDCRHKDFIGTRSQSKRHDIERIC